MENLKIRVSNAAESERAQRAFFALGYRWGDSDFEYMDSNGIMCAFQYGIFAFEAHKLLSSCAFSTTFFDNKSIEINLADLEALAQKAQMGEGLNSFETMVEETQGKDPGEVCTLPNGLKVWRRTGEMGEINYYGENCGSPFPIWSTLNSMDELRAILHDLESQMPGYIEQRNEAERLLWKIRCEMVADLTKDRSKDYDPYLRIAGNPPRIYTRNEFAKAISYETPDGLSALVVLLNLAADLMVRGKEPKPSQAERRYKAAEKLLDECGFYASGDYSDTAYQALRIAAGL